MGIIITLLLIGIVFKILGFIFKIVGKVLGCVFGLLGYALIGVLAITVLKLVIYSFPIIMAVGIAAIVVLCKKII